MEETPGKTSNKWHTLLAWSAALLAVCSLVGWWTGHLLLSTGLPNRPALSPMTAVGLLLASVGVALLVRRPAAAFAAGFVLALAGLGAVAAHHFGLPQSPGFLPESWWSSRITSGGFFALGAATMLLASGRAVVGQAMALMVFLMAVLVGLGHVVPSADLYKVLPGNGVAIPTILAFGALSLGQLVSLRDAGLAASLTARNQTGRIGATLLVSGVGVLLLLTVVVATALRRGAFDAATAVLLVGWGGVAVLIATLWSLAVSADRAEQALALAEQKRRHLQQVFGAAIAHDLRTPLQVATLTTGLLQRQAQDPAQTQVLARLQRSHARLDRLLRALLDSFALETGGGITLAPSQTDLRAVVEQVVAENDAVLGERVTVRGGAQGWWDRDALVRVVENLLLNAVKYGAPGTPVECDIATQGDEVRLRVRNQGEPIADAERESIFQPFARGARALQSQQPGWGVGLAYARAAAEAHGGRLAVARSDGEGTVFELVLRAGDGAAG